MSGPVYVYGIVESEGAPPGSGPGVPDTGDVRTVAVADGLYLVLADADAKAWAEDAIGDGLRDMDWVGARAIAHAEVLASFLARQALIPMKAFTLFSSEARALDDVRARLETVRTVLARVRGSVEWGLRMRFDEQAARERQLRAASEKPASGAAFRQRKTQLHESAKNARADAYAAARGVAERIAKIAREARVVPAPAAAGGTSSLLLEVAYLAPRASSAEIEALIAGERDALAAVGVEPELTGPWAPFHFATPPDGAGERRDV